ncbi:MAG: hypothetical protein QOE70_2869 [Chthoniobacter sp.]|jgi:hypothetical protein|nr:hypothetical protein [Chthoniobacter sp.]
MRSRFSQRREANGAVGTTFGGGAPSIIRGWRGLNPGSVSYRSDGPQPNARYARLRPPASAARESINAQRIKLESDKKYLLSAWIRASRSDGSTRLTGRFFDKDGKEIGTVSTNATAGDGRWVFVPVRLTRGNRAAEGEQGVPAAAMEFEPVIETGVGCDVEDLYFGPVGPKIGEPQVDR